MRQDLPLIAFNRGIISPLALARTDLKAAMMAAEDQTNYVPRAFGSMMLRPGTEYIDTFQTPATSMEADDNIYLIPFVYDNNDTAIIEVFNTSTFVGVDTGIIRIRVDDELIDYPVVGTTITNTSFVGPGGGWTDIDDAGATSQLIGDLSLVSNNGYAYARRYQEVTVSGGDVNTEHAIEVDVSVGEATFSIGTTQGDDDYVTRTVLPEGRYIFSFTPSGNFFIDLSGNTKYTTLVNSVDLVSGYSFFVFTGVGHGLEENISDIRYRQSADVIYLSFGNDYVYGVNQAWRTYKIQRFGPRSWAMTDYLQNSGPFLPYNKTGVTLAPSGISGDVTVTASDSFFKVKHIGALLSIDSIGQKVSTDVTGADQFTGDIRVFGLNRPFTVTLAGTWVATVTLQRSIGVSGTWVDVATYTSNTTIPFDDDLDNQNIYYRIGVKTGDYTSGTVEADLEYSAGSITGVCRITGVSTAISAGADVLVDFGGVDASLNWREGRWSHLRGFPDAVEIHDSRLFWAGKQYIDGSEVDDYESFDDTIEGDSKPISRSIGYGPMDHINWLASQERLFMGTAASEIQVKASTFEAPLTETDFSLKDASTQGSADIAAVKLDGSIIYVGKTGTRLFRLYYDGDMKQYNSTELTVLNPELLEEGVVKMVIQRQPDTRIHALLEDGTVAILMSDPLEEVAAWVKYTTDGEVKDMVVLPGAEEDRVYYAIARTVDGDTPVYLEKWALESECQGGDLNKQADSFVVYDSTATTTPFTTELLHLAGETVVIWADGVYVGTDTVTAGGALTSALSTAASKVVTGLSYVAQFKSVKLAYGSSLGTALTKKKHINQLGLILKNTHASGLYVGGDFNHLHTIPKAELPTVSDVPNTDHIFEDFDMDMMPFDDQWTTDSRLCLQATAPKPCTILAAVVGLKTND